MSRRLPSENWEEVQAQIARFIQERDWEQFHSPKNVSMSIAIADAEWLAHFQWANSAEESRQVLKDPVKKQEIEDELADIAIYLLDFCHLQQIDLAQAIKNKMKKNEAKYPVARAKGKSDKYTAYQK